MSVGDLEFIGGIRLIAWEWALANEAPSAPNYIRRGPVPFGAVSVTDAVAIMMGSQAHLEVHVRWADDDSGRSSALNALILKPLYLPFYGFGSAGPDGDRGNPVPCRLPDRDERLPDAGLGAAYSAANIPGQVVLTDLPAAASDPVTLQLHDLQYRLPKPAGSGGAGTFVQKRAWETRLWGQEPQTFGQSSDDPALQQIAQERSWFMEIDWEPGGRGVDTPFVSGDAITIIYRMGRQS